MRCLIYQCRFNWVLLFVHFQGHHLMVYRSVMLLYLSTYLICLFIVSYYGYFQRFSDLIIDITLCSCRKLVCQHGYISFVLPHRGYQSSHPYPSPYITPTWVSFSVQHCQALLLCLIRQFHSSSLLCCNIIRWLWQSVVHVQFVSHIFNSWIKAGYSCIITCHRWRNMLTLFAWIHSHISCRLTSYHWE